MPNRAIEFHDSTLDSVRRDETNLTVRFSAAYIHESSGEPGLDVGSGWVQEALLHIVGASLSNEVHELPCVLWDGDMRLGGELFQMIPIPLNYEGVVEINLERDGQILLLRLQSGGVIQRLSGRNAIG
jgi:hypothetical protein